MNIKKLSKSSTQSDIIKKINDKNKYNNFKDNPSIIWLKKFKPPLTKPLNPVPLDHPAIKVGGNILR